MNKVFLPNELGKIGEMGATVGEEEGKNGKIKEKILQSKGFEPLHAYAYYDLNVTPWTNSGKTDHGAHVATPGGFERTFSFCIMILSSHNFYCLNQLCK
jgi:hypothetical protein